MLIYKFRIASAPAHRDSLAKLLLIAKRHSLGFAFVSTLSRSSSTHNSRILCARPSLTLPRDYCQVALQRCCLTMQNKKLSGEEDRG